MVKNSSSLRVVARLRPDRSRRAGIVVAALITSALAGVGVAEDRFYVMPGGQRVRLTKSANEYGLVLRSCDDAEACAQRLSDEGHGTLESFPWAPHARMKLLRVAKTSATGKAAIQRDPVIQDVRSIYRFEGLDAPAMSTGTIAAKLRPNVSDAARELLWKDHGIAKVEPIIGQPRVFLLTPNGEDDDEVLLAELLSGDARVQWAQPNLRREVRTSQITPSDPLFRLQWHLNNTGQAGGTEGADIDALEAWAITGGEGVLFGIYDDSCDVDHEDLLDNYKHACSIGGQNCDAQTPCPSGAGTCQGVGQDATLEPNAEGADDPRPKEFGDRHGTAVMGLAVARANNLGVRGVAHGAKFTVSRGLLEAASDVEIARVYTFAREQNVDVHINSWGIPGAPDPAVIADSLDLAFREGRNKGDLDGDGDDDPLGMVIVFASHNQGVQLSPGFALSMLPQVIGVGASNHRDVRASYSNYGTGIDVLAPGGDDFDALLVTTDNTDSPDAIDLGNNVGGFHVFGFPEVEPTGKYSGYFSGTSAACPVAAGVAGLILSVNPLLSATDVRLILEHTADKISPADAEYNTITSRSLRYGYGRINAGGAVEAALESLDNSGRTWPDRAGDLYIEGLSIRWTQNLGTDEFLVVQSESAFDFIPVDGACYNANQDSCEGELRSLPGGVSVLATGCNLKCDPSDVAGCQAGATQCVPFAGSNKLYFGIYARNSSSGRYSFGVAADSDNHVTDSGDVVGGGDPGGVPPTSGPSVTIIVADQELEGTSPWTVHFNSDVESDVAIDESKTAWDFDVDDGQDSPDAIRTRAPTNTYSVDAGKNRTFVARLTMYDIEGHSGSDEVAIQVQGPEVDDTAGNGDVQIIVGTPGAPNSDVDGGTAPFSVLLSIRATVTSDTVDSVVVAWDLGDGTKITAQSVHHTYENTTDFDLRIPIVATVTTTSGATTSTSTATRIITVAPGVEEDDSGDPVLPGTTPQGEGGAADMPCSGVGMIPLLLMLTSLLWMRRRY